MNAPFFYLLINDQKQGPYALDQVRGMWDSGAITADTLYWHDGMSDWGQVHSLISQQQTDTTLPLQTGVFYLDHQNNVVGPVPQEALRELHRNNEISALTQVCQAGDEEWHPYHIAAERWKNDQPETMDKSIAPKSVERSDFALIVTGLVLSILVISVLVGLAIYGNQQSASSTPPHKTANDYRAVMRETLAAMAKTAETADMLCVSHSEAWKGALGGRNAAMKEAVELSVQLNQDSINKVKESLQTIKGGMEFLNSPPDAYKETHNKLVSIYGTTTTLCDLAISPSGSFQSFGESVRNCRASLLRQLSEIAVTMPKE